MPTSISARVQGDALLAGKIVVRGREIQDENKRPLASWTINGNMALSMAGAKAARTSGLLCGQNRRLSAQRLTARAGGGWKQTNRSGREMR